MISWPARLANLILRLMRYKAQGSQRWRRPPRRRRAFAPPWFFPLLVRISRIVYKERRIITLSPRKPTAGRHVLFFHGGAYASEITFWHWLFAARITRAAHCRCSLIEYPLSPEHDHRDTLRHVVAAFRELIPPGAEPPILMGDSAGGGLALALAMSLRDQDAIPPPDRLVLISPWLDLTQCTPVPAGLQEQDHILAPEALRIAAANYAGPTVLTDYRLSPIYGNFAALGKLGVWMGTSEIFYPELSRLRTKLEQAGTPFQFFIGESMQHDYPILPIPEGRRAVREIAHFINA